MENVIRIENGKYIAGKASGESVHANVLTKLWENPNPSATFAAQNIVLSSSDYDFLMFIGRLINGSARDISVIAPKGDSAYFVFSTYSSGAAHSSTRLFIYTDDTHLAVSDASVDSSTNNAYLIPVTIYGLKKSIDITAIVSNVSTDARQCMLSDGVTSVSAVLEKGSVTVTGDGVKTYAQLLNTLNGLIDYTKISTKSVFVRNATNGNNIVFQMISYYSGEAYFTRTSVTSTQLVNDMITIGSSSAWVRSVTTTSSTTFSNQANNAVPNGEKLTIVY